MEGDSPSVAGPSVSGAAPDFDIDVDVMGGGSPAAAGSGSGSARTSHRASASNGKPKAKPKSQGRRGVRASADDWELDCEICGAHGFNVVRVSRFAVHVHL